MCIPVQEPSHATRRERRGGDSPLRCPGAPEMGCRSRHRGPAPVTTGSQAADLLAGVGSLDCGSGWAGAGAVACRGPGRLDRACRGQCVRWVASDPRVEGSSRCSSPAVVARVSKAPPRARSRVAIRHDADCPIIVRDWIASCRASGQGVAAKNTNEAEQTERVQGSRSRPEHRVPVRPRPVVRRCTLAAGARRCPPDQQDVRRTCHCWIGPPTQRRGGYCRLLYPPRPDGRA